MAGERDLQTLLKAMQPELQDGVFVFCAIRKERTSRPRSSRA